MILKSEFARVTVELDNTGNGPRLMIRDDWAERAIYLDPLELASLAWCEHQDLAPFVDPGRITPEEEEGEDNLAAMLGDLDLTP